MTKEKHYIAVDLGAESGRVILGTVSAEKLTLSEIYRFPSCMVEENASLRWDFAKLFSQVKTGIAKTIKQTTGKICGIAVDSWGVDFGLLDENGNLIEKPYHYRDSRTNGVMEKAFELMDKRQIFENSGLQFRQLDTLFQLLAMRLANSSSLAKAKTLLFMADLVAYHLSGQIYAEYTLASTSHFMDMRTGQWSKKILRSLDLPMHIMPRLVQAGTIVGKLKKQLCDELGSDPINVIATASHDTADAVAAVPAKNDNWAYLSSGTWSLMGIETPKAIINDKSFNYDFTNEGGVKNTIRFLKNIMGLWLLQESRRQWQRQGIDFSYNQLEEMADKAEPFAASIDPDYNAFLAPGDMPARINEYLEKTSQSKLSDKGQFVRVILESLALKYRNTIEAIEDITGKSIDVLHIVGGGLQNELLCQFTADAIGKKVITGPVEATASGNIITQAMACGQIKSLAEARNIVSNSFDVKEYLPQQTDDWAKGYEKFKKL